MIRQWQIRNFKAIKGDMDYIDFAPITVFAGANSSGKSTIIQSILLMMQTLSVRANASLLFNGELVSLGTCDDVWNNHILQADGHETEPLEYSIVIDNPKRDDEFLGVDLVFKPSTGTRNRLVAGHYRMILKDTELGLYIEYNQNTRQYELREITTTLDATMRDQFKSKGLHDIQPFHQAHIDMRGLFPRNIHVQAKVPAVKLNWDIALLNPFDKRIDATDLKQEIPDQYKRIIKRITKQYNLSDFVQVASHNEEIEIVNTLADYKDWFNNLSNKQTTILYDDLVVHLNNVLVDETIDMRIPVLDEIERTFKNLILRNIRYLGASRIGPTIVFSPDVTSEWSEVGINGGNVAATLRENSKRVISWYDPQTFETKETKLIEAVVIWLQFFGLLEGVATEEQGKLGTMLKIRSEGVQRDMDLTSVGFGTSQILPIIVQGLLTPPGGTFIVEQPEVHLHPHLQSLLANFFVALHMAGVQSIVETHSENLVNQLRLFIANKSKLRDDIKMYFANRNATDGTSFQEVMISDDGSILNWPVGFMDESKRQAEQMLRAILANEDY